MKIKLREMRLKVELYKSLTHETDLKCQILGYSKCYTDFILE